MSLDLIAPQPLTPDHHCADFSCGEPVLDEWFRRRAMVNQVSGASRTFVVTNKERRVYGYYAMSAGAVSHQLATGGVRRNMPDPVPVMVLARLAVATQAQGIKLGGSLLHDAVSRAVNVAQNTGVRALLVHALHERAKLFYEYYGFHASPADPLVLMLRLSHAKP
ncbi:MAG: GNAT family N-acetyltransferase [Proteobacteria bacterium]|nr:GNAT family N-acetyltransferase [Pseudomonadota bacterium]MBS0463767.1 GNAT family N-acetyltransferase [Pseudomonadota bacterium]